MGKAKVKDDKDKTDPKSNANNEKKLFYCDKIGHVKADCRKKKDDEERKTTLAQNSLTSSLVTMSPPGLTNDHFWDQHLVPSTAHCPVTRLG